MLALAGCGDTSIGGASGRTSPDPLCAASRPPEDPARALPGPTDRARAPRVEGLALDRALARLRAPAALDAHLTLRTAGAPRGRVVAQWPEPGAAVAAGSNVELIVSSGPGGRSSACPY